MASSPVCTRCGAPQAEHWGVNITSDRQQEYAQTDALSTRVAHLLARMDGMDCTHREGGDIRHCPLDAKCLRCEVDRLRQRVIDQDAEIVALHAVEVEAQRLEAEVERLRQESLLADDDAHRAELAEYARRYREEFFAARARIEALRPRDGAPTDHGLGFESAIDAALAALEER